MKIVSPILFLTLFCTPYHIHAQTKRALVIGIGQYEDPAWNKINGDKDVPYVLEILKEANYEQIITCVNEEATKAGILSALRVLTKESQSNDIIYIHFSGHGQQMKDMGNDESDSIDECWIPYDAYRKPSDKYRGEKHLVDDEVNILLTRIRNKIGDEGRMLVVIDACHSGDATREVETTKDVARGVDDIFEAVKSLFKISHSETCTDVHANTEQWITLSACESDQVNFEMKTPVVGKLTYALYLNIKNKMLRSNEEFFMQLKRTVNFNTTSQPQEPTMTGEIGRYNITDILR